MWVVNNLFFPQIFKNCSNCQQRQRRPCRGRWLFHLVRQNFKQQSKYPQNWSFDQRPLVVTVVWWEKC